MKTTTVSLHVILLIGADAVGAADQDRSSTPRVQDRQFLFSVSAPPSDAPHATVHLESGFGDRAFDLVEGDRPEQRFGVQAFIGNRVTLLARVGFSSDARDLRSSQQAELLYSVLEQRRSHASLAVGMGMRHESAGVNVLLGRVVAGRSFEAWRVDGNAVFEKPFSSGRDAVDLITTFGVARRILPALYAGVELIGEDLEGFWETEEAEGGARLLVGPSIRIAPATRHWQVSAAGGPIVRATRNDLSSGATRGLPNSPAGDGYAVRISFSYGF